MEEQHPNGAYRNEQTADKKKYPKKRRRRLRKGTVLIAAIIVIVVAVVILITNKSGKKTNALIGTWRYDEHTQYVFEKDGTGKLLADDVTYTYAYSVDGKKLTLDFTDDIVLDCDYTFSVKKSTLKLVGGNGTDGGSYQLTKNKANSK